MSDLGSQLVGHASPGGDRRPPPPRVGPPELVGLRNTHPAFDGSLHVKTDGENSLRLHWQHGQSSCTLEVDVAAGHTTVDDGNRRIAGTRWGAVSRAALGIGEILWDLLPGGERLGGAPFNVVAHLHRFGWTSRYVSAVGNDPYGRRALREAVRLGVDTSLIEVNERPTGLVRVRVDPAGEADYEIVSPAAYEAIVPHHGRSEALDERVDLITFGTLAQRFPGVRAATHQLATEAPDAVLLYDVNLRRNCWDPALVEHLLTLATVVKLNRGEQQVLAAELALPADPIEAFAPTASERYGLRGVCVTSGPSGAALLLDGTYAEAPTPTVQVVDTVGAGDAFAAAVGKGVVEARPVAEILDVANRLGALVASRPGAIPDWNPSDI